jgi:hypothetical protein
MTLQRYVGGSRQDMIAGNRKYLIYRVVLIELESTCHVTPRWCTTGGGV